MIAGCSAVRDEAAFERMQTTKPTCSNAVVSAAQGELKRVGELSTRDDWPYVTASLWLTKVDVACAESYDDWAGKREMFAGRNRTL